MAKTKISEFSSTPANNTDIDSINIAEGCAPSGINDAIRELMAQLKDFQTGAQGDSFNGPIGTSTAAAGAFTTLSATGAITSTLATGTAPLVIASTTKVSNLNVDLLDGADWASPAALGSTTPAAVSATTLAASGAVTLSGGTANGVAYLNGSKVVTSGSALTFDGTSFGVLSASNNIAQFSGAANGYVDFTNGTITGRIQTSGSVRFGSITNHDVAFLQNNTEVGRFTSTGLGIGTSSPTNTLSVSGSANITGNVTLGDASTDTVTVNGYMGVGGAAGASTAITVAPTALTGTLQYGVSAQPTGTSAATNSIIAFDAYAQVANSAFTVSNVYGLSIRSGSKGASATATNWHGIQIADQTQGTNNYGITSLVSSGTNKFNIYASGTAANYFAGNVGIGTSSPNTNLEISTTVDPILRLNNSTNAVTTGADIGEIQFYTNDASTNGTGVKAFVKAVAGSFGAAQGAAALAFGTAADGAGNASEKMRLDRDGNLGLGVTPSAWSTAQRAIQLASNGSVASSATYPISLSSNAVATSNGWAANYIADGFATLYAHSAGQHRWFTAPSGTAGTAITFTQAMTLDASGNLGIGTSSPTTKLDVVGSGDSEVRIRATSDASLIFSETTANKNWKLKPSAGDFYWQYSATAYNSGYSALMALTSTGNLGIGTSSPAFKLDVVAASNSANTIAVRNTDTSTANYSTQAYFRIDVAGNHIGGLKSTAKSLGGLSTQALYLTTAGAYPIAFGLNDSATPSMVLDTSGNLGVGTSSPARKLDVYGSGQFKDASGIQNVIWSEFSTGVAGIGTNNNYPIAFVSNGSERARIDSSGRFMLGTTTTSITNSEAKYFDAADGMRLFSARASTASREHIIFQNPNGTVGSISTSGSATTYSTSSDYRLKNTIAPMTGALSKVALLKPVTYKWNADGSDGEGFIAHELAEVMPHAVTGEKDAVDENGNPKYQGIDTSFLVATLTAAIQELKAEFDAYKASHP